MTVFGEQPWAKPVGLLIRVWTNPNYNLNVKCVAEFWGLLYFFYLLGITPHLGGFPSLLYLLTNERHLGAISHHLHHIHKESWLVRADMQFVTNFTRIKFWNNFLPKKGVNYDKLCYPKKQRNLYFHILNMHTQGYITLNKYIIGIASIGLPKVNLWKLNVSLNVVKCSKNTTFGKTPYVQTKNLPQKINILHG